MWFGFKNIVAFEFESKLITSCKINKTFISYIIDKKLLSMAGGEGPAIYAPDCQRQKRKVLPPGKWKVFSGSSTNPSLFGKETKSPEFRGKTGAAFSLPSLADVMVTGRKCVDAVLTVTGSLKATYHAAPGTKPFALFKYGRT